jgi:hypothetical protein
MTPVVFRIVALSVKAKFRSVTPEGLQMEPDDQLVLEEQAAATSSGLAEQAQ